MVDRPPPTRFSVVERGGRLVVIDMQAGHARRGAAERMDLYDRSMGVEPIRPERASAAPGMAAAARAESGLSARPAPAQQRTATATDSGKARVAAAVTERNKRPWTAPQSDRPALKANTPAARLPARAAPQSGALKTIVTGKWWDAKGPRTIELSPKGQQRLSSGFVTLFLAVVVAAIVALFIEPLLLLVGGFLLFRFGNTILGPLGAGIVDKAIAEKG